MPLECEDDEHLVPSEAMIKVLHSPKLESKFPLPHFVPWIPMIKFLDRYKHEHDKIWKYDVLFVPYILVLHFQVIHKEVQKNLLL